MKERQCNKTNANIEIGVVVHWIFDPSHHGKGECDGHGAVVKSGIRFFVLKGKYQHWFHNCSLLDSIADEHHIDDELEAVDFINQHIRNTTAFTMYVDADETEEDCTALHGSNSLHEMRYFLHS